VQVFNETPFAFASIMGKVDFPKDILTLIVKGTYAMTPGAAILLPADEQMPPTGDLFYDDDPHTTVRYESDFANFKPRADVLLVGHCHVPEGRAGMCSVTFQAGPVSKTLVAFGDRSWRRNLLGYRSPSEPQPFARMALRYEKSLGGPGDPHNPVGKGIRPSKDKSSAPAGHPLPNLEMLVGDRIAPSQANGTPAGLGPLGRTWSQRMALVGGYTEKWRKKRWPWLPDDFNWAYFNAAPLDQQVEGYLKGDESLYFKNLHPVHNQWRAALPGMRVRCFLSERIDGSRKFREVKMELDTLWVDMDESRLVLVWRGVTTVASPEVHQIDELLIVQEPLRDVWRSVAAYEALLARRNAEAAAPQTQETGEPEALTDSLPDEAPDAAAATDAREDAALNAALERALVQVQHSLEHLNLDPTVAVGLKAEKDPKRLAEQLMLVMPVDPQAVEKVKALARQAFKEGRARHRPEMEKLLAQMGEDPAMLDSPDMELLFGVSGDGAPPAGAAGPGAVRRPTALREQDLSGADFSGLSLQRADFRSARLAGAHFAATRLAGADFSQADLAGADFKGADLRGAKFSGADLDRACLESATLSGAELCDAVLTQANLREADLSDARLMRAQLGQANLYRCVLKGADLEHADLSEANLSEADLTKARLSFTLFEGADLTRAVLRRAVAPSSAFNRTVLTQTDFSEAQLEDGNFCDCRCDSAIFHSARLSRASLEGAAGGRVIFIQACLDGVRAGEAVSMPEALFREAAGKGGNWAGANLAGADFVAADMACCDFSQADLSGCEAGAADMQDSVFDQAVLQQSKFNEANLFQARLELADLRGASFRKCNLYGAEFLNATIDDRTTFAAANLHDTKLAGMNR
jgi:uncharacterized protein YjbI with pentapeptide repeats